MIVKNSGVELVVRGDPERALKIPNAVQGHTITRCSLTVKSHKV